MLGDEFERVVAEGVGWKHVYNNHVGWTKLDSYVLQIYWYYERISDLYAWKGMKEHDGGNDMFKGVKWFSRDFALKMHSKWSSS